MRGKHCAALIVLVVASGCDWIPPSKCPTPCPNGDHTLYLRLTNSANAPSYFEVTKLAALEDNGSRTNLGIVPCEVPSGGTSGNSPAPNDGGTDGGMAVSTPVGGAVLGGSHVDCVISNLHPGFRVEITRISEGKTSVARSFDLPKKLDLFNQYSYGTATSPVTVSIDGNSVPEFSAADMENALLKLAYSVSIRDGFKPMPRAASQDTYLGRFFVAEAVDDRPKDPNFNQVFGSYTTPLQAKDRPNLESIFPIQYETEVLTSFAAKAKAESNIPAIAAISLNASGSLYTKLEHRSS